MNHCEFNYCFQVISNSNFLLAEVVFVKGFWSALLQFLNKFKTNVYPDGQFSLSHFLSILIILGIFSFKHISFHFAFFLLILILVSGVLLILDA